MCPHAADDVGECAVSVCIGVVSIGWDAPMIVVKVLPIRQREKSMMRKQVRMAGVMVMVSLLWFVPGVLAEPFVGVYGGLSLAADSDFTSADFIGTGATKDLD